MFVEGLPCGFDDACTEVGPLFVFVLDSEHLFELVYLEGSLADFAVLGKDFVYADGVYAGEVEDVSDVVHQELGPELQEKGFHLGVEGNVHVGAIYGVYEAVYACNDGCTELFEALAGLSHDADGFLHHFVSTLSETVVGVFVVRDAELFDEVGEVDAVFFEILVIFVDECEHLEEDSHLPNVESVLAFDELVGFLNELNGSHKFSNCVRMPQKV